MQDTIITPLDVCGESVSFDGTATYQLFLMGQDILLRIPWMATALPEFSHECDGITVTLARGLPRGALARRERDGKLYPSSHTTCLSLNSAKDDQLVISVGARSHIDALKFIHIRTTTTDNAHALHARLNDALFKIMKNIHLSRKQDSTTTPPAA